MRRRVGELWSRSSVRGPPSLTTCQPGGTTAACVAGATVVTGVVVVGTVVGGAVATVEATARDPSPSGSPVTATATANDTSASTTDPPAISSTRRTTGSIAFRATRDPYPAPLAPAVPQPCWDPGPSDPAGPQPPQDPGLWIPGGAESRDGLASPSGGPDIGRFGCGTPCSPGTGWATPSPAPTPTADPAVAGGRGLPARGSRMRRVSGRVGRPPAGLVRRAWRAGARGPASSGMRGGAVRMAVRVRSLPSPAKGVSPSTARNRIAPGTRGRPAGRPGRL